VLRLAAATLAALIISAVAQADAETESAPANACGTASDLAHALFEGEVYGAHGLERPLSDRLAFALVPAEHGWKVEVRDAEGWDLALMTPPRDLEAVNPRVIAGWHFRNAENTGANQGDVNAPQATRAFVFGPESLAEDLGTDDIPAVEVAGPRVGRGALEIVDQGLADLAPGETARMVYMKFSACLEWSPAPGEALEEDVVPPAYPRAIQDRFAACGLNGEHGFSNHLGQGRAGLGASWLELDVDADGARDIAAPIVRAADGKRGLAVCRDGRLDLLGLEGGYGRRVVAEYFDNIDWWSVAPAGLTAVGAEGGEPPTLAGEGIVIGKDDSSSVLVYWDGAAWAGYWQGD
jgi:hypothetical protein